MKKVLCKLQPTGFRVLIMPDKQPEDEGKLKYGELELELVEDKYEKRARQAANQKGTIIAIGPTAWNAFDNGEPWAKVGDKVTFTKHGGKFVDTGISNPKNPDKTLEGVLLNDEDVTSVWKEEGYEVEIPDFSAEEKVSG